MMTNDPSLNLSMSLFAGLAGATRSAVSFARPFFQYRLLGRVTPVLAGYKITHTCNLKCRHCPYWRRSAEGQDYAGTLATLQRLQSMGIRILIFEGGEPLLWRDKGKDFRDLVREARKLFRCVCVTTNGTLPWKHLPLDRVWVSLDGPRQVHDSIRGAGVFDRVWSNLTREGRGNAFVSTTINTLNRDFVPELITMLHRVVAGVTIQFHYPYEGLPDPLFIPAEDRAPLLAELMRLKKLGYPVSNSFKSLRELRKKRWSCEDRLLANAEPDGTITQGCYLKNRGEADCSRCGFSAHNEMTLAFQGSVQAIYTGMRIFFGHTGEGTLPSESDNV